MGPVCLHCTTDLYERTSIQEQICLTFEYWILWFFALPLLFALRIYSLQIVIFDTHHKGL